MKQYYYADGDQQKGPFSFEELRSKHLSKDTYVWFEGLADWTPAGELSELSSLFQAPPQYVTPEEPTVDLNNPPPPRNQGGYTPRRQMADGGYQSRHSPNSGEKPKTWLVESILATVLCCLPAGIAGIVFASKVDSKWAEGDIAGAQKASENAKLWTMIAVGVGFVVSIIYVLAIIGGSL